MKPETIRRLDVIAGKPVCALLSAVESLRRLFASGSPYIPPKRIVFIKLIEMGSSVLASPAFEEATRMVGRDNIFILLFAPNRPILDILPFFPPQNIITIRDTSLPVFVHDLLGALRRIRRENIDGAIDLEGLTRSSAIITWLTGASRRAGYRNFTAEGPYRGRLFTHELNYGFQHHISKTFLALTRALAHAPGQLPMLKEPVQPGPLPVFTPSETELAAVREKIRARAGRDPSGPIVLLNPNCSDLLPLRRWPDESFIDLAHRILDQWPDSLVILTGAPSEQEGAEILVKQIDRPPSRCISLAGHTTLREIFALYTLSSVLVTNDSGPGHFASLTPIGEVVLFGPETPLLYGPLGQRKVALTAGLACSPCVNMLNHRFSPCHDPQCMKRISPELVMAHVRALLDNQPIPAKP
jgi:ADP-heptose:LPS heptosyltransferase